MAIPRTRPYSGPALFSYGFRPFFLFGALYAGAAILYWIPMLAGHVETASLLDPVDWHIHEMLFGYLAAVMAGFLLTAIPNWTGRLPLNGLPLVVLVAAWLAGRVAIFCSSAIGAIPAAIVDCAFLTLLVAATGREIIAGKNWRNLKVLIPVSVLLAANVLFHLEAALTGTTDIARRLSIAAAILLISIIGGRVIPSFTRNWLVKREPGALPASFDRFDVFALGLTGVALTFWVFAPTQIATGAVMLAAAIVNIARLARWRGYRTISDPLVLILHIGFMWIPAGMAIAGLAAIMPDRVAPAAAIHAFGVGAIGTMTLAIMVRATLGHTGHDLVSGWRGNLVFTAITIAALARLAHALIWPANPLLHLAAAAWAFAFLGFAGLFGRALLSPRRK